MLKQLTAKGVGPFDPLEMTFAPRINLVTGDNGVGKTFLLDLCWYVLTGEWANYPALAKGKIDQSKISAKTLSHQIEANLPVSNYQWKSKIKKLKALNPMVLYIGAEGNYKLHWTLPNPDGFEPYNHSFTKTELWFGKTEQSGRSISNGLINDLNDWREKAENIMFNAIVLKKLESSGNQTLDDIVNDLINIFNIKDSKTGTTYIKSLAPGLLKEVMNTTSGSSSLKLDFILHLMSENPQKPLNLTDAKTAFGDSRKIPFLKHTYGKEPITLASAGVKRILSVCYFLIWAWQRNLEQQRDNQLPAIDQIIILFDEVESHLHPAWQRKILPAFVEAMAQIHDNKVDVQLIATTHSPLVAASLDGVFDSKTDRLFTLEQDPESGLVHAEAQDYLEVGDFSHWLRSDIFGNTPAYSTEAESVLKAAKAYMSGKRGDALPKGYQTSEAIEQGLRQKIASYENIWPRWQAYLETHPDPLNPEAKLKKVIKKGKKA